MRKKSALTIKNQVPKKDFQCNICNKTGFSTAYKLKSHMFIHNAIKPRFRCEYCLKDFYRSDTYNRHMATHKKSQKLHNCEYCDRNFIDKRNLNTHLLNVHDENIDKPEYKCTECGATYCEQRLIKHHIRKVHLKLDTQNKQKLPIHVLKNLNETWIEKVKDTNNCVQITKVKPNKLTIKSCALKRMSDIKNDDEMNIFQRYQASVFASKDNYYSKAICDYCNKEMLKKSIVVHIRERHLKLRRFQCDCCSKTFNRHYQLCMHNCKLSDVKKEVKDEEKEVIA